MEIIGFLWTEGLTRPMTNGLVFFYSIFGQNFGVAIIMFTIATRVLMYPLTVRQLRSMRAMQGLQPRVKEIQEKYKNDRQRLQREQMRLFKEAGVNPVGCLGGFFLQMPIFFGLFQVLRTVLADTPEDLVTLSQRLYSWLPGVSEVIPLDRHFIGMDLGALVSENSAFFALALPLFVGGSMWVVQKMSQTPTLDPTQQATTRMTTLLFPIMFGFWTFFFPTGLAIYWLTSNVISIGLQYRVTGWGMLRAQPQPEPSGDRAAIEAPKAPPREEREEQPAPQRPDVIDVEARRSAPPAPVGQRTGGLVGLVKRIFLGTPSVAAPPASEEGDEDQQASPTSTATVEEGAEHGRRGSDRKDRGRGDRKGPEPTRRRSGRRGRRRRR